jgi:hypothetical protein
MAAVSVNYMYIVVAAKVMPDSINKLQNEAKN